MWVHWLLLACLVLVIAETVALMWLAPHYLVRRIEHATGGRLLIDRARLSLLPPTVILMDVRLAHVPPEASLTVQRATIKPRWVSWTSRTIWVDSFDIEQPFIRVTHTKAGTFLWPNVRSTAKGSQGDVTAALPPTEHSTNASSWRVQIGSIKISDGIVELVDEHSPRSFHGVLDHVSFTIGPLTLPPSSMETAFAFRSEFVGDAGHAAPLYCSGWGDVLAKDLRAFCQLEPLAMGAFEPYYQGRLKVRVYNATLKATSQWIARSNELDGRLQLELDHLSEGDLSVRGTTVMDIKRLSSGHEPRLRAELKLVGPLDNPGEWRPEFVPGNALVQQFVKPLLDRGIEMVRIPFGGRTITISLTPATTEAITGIEEASKQVEDALQILAAPVPPPSRSS